MVKVIYTKRFLKLAKKLPPLTQDRLGSKLEILQENPFNSLLHTKALTGKLVGFYSFRITRAWRVIFIFIDSRTVKLIDVAHKKDIYRK